MSSQETTAGRPFEQAFRVPARPVSTGAPHRPSPESRDAATSESQLAKPLARPLDSFGVSEKNRKYTLFCSTRRPAALKPSCSHLFHVPSPLSPLLHTSTSSSDPSAVSKLVSYLHSCSLETSPTTRKPAPADCFSEHRSSRVGKGRLSPTILPCLLLLSSPSTRLCWQSKPVGLLLSSRPHRINYRYLLIITSSMTIATAAKLLLLILCLTPFTKAAECSPPKEGCGVCDRTATGPCTSCNGDSPNSPALDAPSVLQESTRIDVVLRPFRALRPDW